MLTLKEFIELEEIIRLSEEATKLKGTPIVSLDDRDESDYKSVSEEQIDEISGKTLGSYIQKARSDINSRIAANAETDADPKVKAQSDKILDYYNSRQYNSRGESIHRSKIEKAREKQDTIRHKIDPEYTNNIKTTTKRRKGIDAAINKLQYGKLSENDFEAHVKKHLAEYQLDEAKVVPNMGRFQVVHKGVVVGTYNAKFEAQDRANSINDNAKRMKSMKTEEQIDELSKQTLGSYIKKATGGLNGVGRHAFDSGNTLGKADGEDSPSAKSFAIARKRIKGVEKATDRLMKEDEIQESMYSADHYKKVAAPHALKQAEAEKPGSKEHAKWMAVHHTALRAHSSMTGDADSEKYHARMAEYHADHAGDDDSFHDGDSHHWDKF